jgi:hypothetical protein
MAKFRRDYPSWQMRYSLETIIDEMVGARLPSS